MDAHPDLAAINAAPDAIAAALILPFVERAPAIAARVALLRPFASAAALSDGIETEVGQMGETETLAFFRGHPELAPLDPAAMTEASQHEQGRLGLDSTNAATGELSELNRLYRERFGFPFILALHEHSDLASVLATFRRRLTATRDAEIAENRRQICSVSRARVARAFGSAEPATP